MNRNLSDATCLPLGTLLFTFLYIHKLEAFKNRMFKMFVIFLANWNIIHDGDKYIETLNNQTICYVECRWHVWMCFNFRDSFGDVYFMFEWSMKRT